MKHSSKNIVSEPPFNTTYTFEAIGTQWKIELQLSQPKPTARVELLQEIMIIIDQFDRTFSRFRPDSLVTTIAKTPGTYQFPDYAEPLFNLYHQLYQQTKGKLTPLIGQTMVAAGYDPQYSFIVNQPQPAQPWDESIIYTAPYLQTTHPVLIDVGAIGKGYVVDLVSKLLRSNDITTFYINAGGDIYYQGASPIDVALEHPSDPGQAVGIASLHNQAICCSAGNRRRWANYHHLIDPHTTTSPTHISSVWVVATTTALADALSTALFFVPPQQLALSEPFDYAIMYPDQSLQTSTNFPAELFVS